jgi:probable phosphoglycerate mutase
MSADGQTTDRPPVATRFVLVRHGEAAGNRDLRYLGATDSALTDRGQEQAVLLGAAVALLAPTALYSSPLVRARSTAAAITATTGLPLQIEEDLREQHFGGWEMLTRAEVLSRDGERLRAWETGADVAPPDGESLPQVRDRVVQLAERLVARHPGETVVLVSHVSPIKALVCAALELPPAGALRMWLEPASICLVDFRMRRDGQLSGVLRGFNAVAHLASLTR